MAGPRAKGATTPPPDSNYLESGDKHDVTTPADTVTTNTPKIVIKPEFDYVTVTEHDNAVRSLRNAISELTEQVADLTLLATQPGGAIEFTEMHTEILLATPDLLNDNTPDYVPADKDDDEGEWFQAGYLR